jgi:hypothetical protein
MASDVEGWRFDVSVVGCEGMIKEMLNTCTTGRSRKELSFDLSSLAGGKNDVRFQ